MATYGELSKFTHDDLKQFTYEQLSRLTVDELTSLASTKINKIYMYSPDLANNLKSTLSTISLNIASSIIYNAVKNIDWQSILIDFLIFIQKLWNFFNFR